MSSLICFIAEFSSSSDDEKHHGPKHILQKISRKGETMPNGYRDLNVLNPDVKSIFQISMVIYINIAFYPYIRVQSDLLTFGPEF